MPVAHGRRAAASTEHARGAEPRPVDHLSQWLFVTEPSEINLANEDIREGVHLVGNVMIDSLDSCDREGESSRVASQIGTKAPFAVLTPTARAMSTTLRASRRSLASLGRWPSSFPSSFRCIPTRPALGKMSLRPTAS